MRILPAGFDDFEELARLAFDDWGGEPEIILKALTPGFSGASVLSVDVRKCHN